MILSSGNFKSKEDIYKQVFSEEELGLFYDKRSKNKNTKMNQTQTEDNAFFLTQTGIKNNENRDKNEKSEDLKL